MAKRKKQYQEQEQEKEQVDHIICVRCKETWHITEFDAVIDRNPMCVVCSTSIGVNQ
jgi:hypothetical protein